MIRALFTAALLLAAPPGRDAIQEVTSPGGITAWLVEDHNIPFTALEIQFKGGTSLDAPGKRGAVNLMTATAGGRRGRDGQPRLCRGARCAGGRDQLRFRRNDSVGVSAKFLTENRDQASTCCARRWSTRVSTRMRWTGCANRCCRTCGRMKRTPAPCVREASTRWPSATIPMDDRRRHVRDGRRPDPRRHGGRAQGALWRATGSSSRPRGDITAEELGKLLGPAAGRPAGDRRAARHRALASDRRG
jgi:hypothetical protein